MAEARLRHVVDHAEDLADLAGCRLGITPVVVDAFEWALLEPLPLAEATLLGFRLLLVQDRPPLVAVKPVR